MIRRLLPLALLLLPAACSTAGEGEFPSLLPRPQEKLGFAEPEAPAPVTVTADPALDAKIGAIVRERGAAARAFDTAAEAAERAAGKAGAAGSDSWLDAQTALGELDSVRGRQQDALDALEELAAARAQTLDPAYPPLDEAIAAARTTVAEQTRRTDGIAARLK